MTSKTYYNMDNNGRTFKIIVREGSKLSDENGNGKNLVTIYNSINDVDAEEVVYEKSPILSFMCKKVIVGEAVVNAMTKYSGGEDWGETAFLFDISTEQHTSTSTYTYIYVGVSIYAFAIHKPIVKFISALGNSSVVYPWAIDVDGCYYLTEEKIILRSTNAKFAKHMNDPDNDPYNYYYSSTGVQEPFYCVELVKRND